MRSLLCRRYKRLWAGIAVLATALAAFPASAQIEATRRVGSVLTEAGPVGIHEVVGGLNHPWGMAFLPDGRLLVTERSAGNLRILGRDGRLSRPVKGTPVVYAQGHGGLLDVALDPNFATNNFIYLSFAAPGPEGSAATALGRGIWQNDSIANFEVLFREEPWITGPNHFGGRIVFGPRGHLFLTLGERFQFQPAQDLSNHLGTVVRLNQDGSIPRDNPFVGRSNAQAAIWSYGHRNIESAGVDPATGILWIAEMGPMGGDELNRPEAGRNYGWPVVSWGMNYNGTDIPNPPTRPEFADAVHRWTPSISPSGMLFYTGDGFPAWRGSTFVGGLTLHGLVRLRMQGQTATEEDRIPLGDRIRDVEQGPDGMIYVLTDQADGRVLRLSPLR